MMKKPKLLYIINHMDWFWTHRVSLARAAREQGWDVTIAAQDDSHKNQLGKEGFHFSALESNQKLSVLSLIKLIHSIYLAIKFEKPDIVHVITLKFSFFTGLAGLFHPSRHYVYTIAGLGYLFSNSPKACALRAFVSPLLKLVLNRRNTKIIFQNPDDQALLINLGIVQENQTHLIRGSGVDMNKFFKTDMPKNDKPIVLMPTRLLHDKGVAVFIEAAKILKSRNIEARFMIAGGVVTTNPTAISETEMQNMIEGTSVEWLGKVDDMPALFQSSNIVAYPSHYREGIPKVLLEACASARPIITTNHPGCRETVEDGKNGYLIPTQNPQALADKLETLIKKPALCQHMGQHSYSLARTQFEESIIIRQTLAVYNIKDEDHYIEQEISTATA